MSRCSQIIAILTRQFSATYSLGDFEEVIDAISKGDIQPEGMITKVIKMNEVVEEGFNTLIHDKDNHVKILVDVSAGVQ